MREYILIDFENVQPATVGALQPGACGILVFLGERQAKVSVDLMEALQPFGSSVEMIRISGSGPNAVDFHIAYTIGRLGQAHPDAGFTIVSRDTGFDPLVRYLTKAGRQCRRVASLGSPAAKAAPARTVPVKVATVKPGQPKPAPARKKSGTERVANTRPAPKAAAKRPALNGRAAEAMERLKGLKAARPRRLKTLQTSIASWFKMSDAEVAEVVRELSERGLLAIDEGKVAYSLK